MACAGRDRHRVGRRTSRPSSPSSASPTTTGHPAQGRGDPARGRSPRLGGRARPGGTPRTAGRAAAVRSGARGARSSPASGSISRSAHAAGARIVPRVRVLSASCWRAVERSASTATPSSRTRLTGPAAGSSPDTPGVPLTRPARRACPDRRPVRRRAAHAGDPAGDRARPSVDRPAPATAPRAGRGRPVRGPDRHVARDDAGRAVARVRGRRAADRNGYVIEAAPGHPGLLALALPWEGRAAHAAVMASAASSRRSSR